MVKINDCAVRGKGGGMDRMSKNGFSSDGETLIQMRFLLNTLLLLVACVNCCDACWYCLELRF